jgi:hypothetical protein
MQTSREQSYQGGSLVGGWSKQATTAKSRQGLPLGVAGRRPLVSGWIWSFWGGQKKMVRECVESRRVGRSRQGRRCRGEEEVECLGERSTTASDSAAEAHAAPLRTAYSIRRSRHRIYPSSSILKSFYSLLLLESWNTSLSREVAYKDRVT